VKITGIAKELSRRRQIDFGGKQESDDVKFQETAKAR
jgi:hypothetical protein